MYSPPVRHSQTPRHVLSLSTPLPNPTPCTLPQYPTPKPHSMYSPLNVTVELSHIHTQPIRNNGQNDSRSSLNCNLHVLRQQTERHRILDRIATGTRGVRASVNSSMRAVLIDWCRTQILELHYTFKGYVSCMHVVVFTFILLTWHDHIPLINFLSIYFQATPATPPPPRHPLLSQLQQENKLNTTNERKSDETSSDVQNLLLPTDAHNVKKHRVIKTF